MSIVTFASLKGGVGKTTLTINVAHALARRDCRVLVIDLDPVGHATRLLMQEHCSSTKDVDTVLARLFLVPELRKSLAEIGVVETAERAELELVLPVREGVDLLPGGESLRHMLWGRGSRAFKEFFRTALGELSNSYDYIVIDTPPDFNVLTRNAIAASSLVVVPVDGSEMSIHCLERIIGQADHIEGPAWAVVRTLVPKSASRTRRASDARLGEKLGMEKVERSGIDDADDFISMVEKHQSEVEESEIQSKNDSPIYLLNSVIYRTERQNQLSFYGRTAFDFKSTSTLADEYSLVSREVEELLSITGEDGEPSQPEGGVSDFLERSFHENLDRDALDTAAV